MMAPAALQRVADCRPCSLPPQWKKQPQAMNAAQIASAPPSGPRKSQVAMAPRTPTLIASAVFEDISSPSLVEERADEPYYAGGPPAQGLEAGCSRRLASVTNVRPKWCQFEHEF